MECAIDVRSPPEQKSRFCIENVARTRPSGLSQTLEVLKESGRLAHLNDAAVRIA
jgi:hypothetical protein